MATRKGLLETGLAASVAEKAITNAIKCSGEEWINEEAHPLESTGDIIGSGFVWHQTPEGGEYWSEIHKEFDNY